LIDTTATLIPADPGSSGISNDWQKEIHPTRIGYVKIARKIAEKLNQFPPIPTCCIWYWFRTCRQLKRAHRNHAQTLGALTYQAALVSAKAFNRPCIAPVAVVID
jgi:hypothetical protein